MDEHIPSLASVLARVPDPRHARGRRHPWSALLLLVVVALLCGANTQHAVARWGRHAGRARLRRLGFTRPGAPSQPTLHRLLKQVEIGRLEALLGSWLQQVWAAWRRSAADWLDGIAVDGKTLRGARRLHAQDARLLAACCQPAGVVLGQVAVQDAAGEAGAVAALLAGLPLAGQTVTFDAAFTQAHVAEQVARRGGAYLLVVKGNQPFLLRACAATTTPPFRRPTRQLGRAHRARRTRGCIEERTLWAAEAPADLGFPYARQVLRLHCRVVHRRTGAVRHEATRYAVTSLEPGQARPPDLLRLWQAHWQIENGVHRVRDMLFGEDAATTRTGHAPQALAALRNLALSLLHLWHGSAVAAAREYYAGHVPALFRRLRLAQRRL